MNALEILEKTIELGGSDIFIVAGLAVVCKVGHKKEKITENKLMPDDTLSIINEIYAMAKRDISYLMETGDDDFSFAIAGLSRFRINTYKQRGTLAAVIRTITFHLPDPKQLGISDSILELANENKGLVLVTGPAGSGKSTTLACMIDYINHRSSKHIITLEDPIEYLHRHDQSIISQREINIDTKSYVTALRASLRQSPDIILLGEMRDLETIEVAMTAAETGHLVLSTLHTIGASKTIDRIIDSFPANQQEQVAVELAMVLNAVVSQQLLPTVDDQVVPVFEIMIVNTAIRNLIRENKTHQIDGVIASSGQSQMISMDNAIIQLYKEGVISKKTAIEYSQNRDLMIKKIGML